MSETREREQPAPPEGRPDHELGKGSVSSSPSEASGEDVEGNHKGSPDATGVGDDETDNLPSSVSNPEAASELSDPNDRNDLLSEAESWASISRSVLLGGVLGFGGATWAQLSFAARWINDLLAENSLPEGQRDTLVKGSLGGVAIGMTIVGVLLWSAQRKGQGLRRIEHWLWFLSPLSMLPALGWVFRPKPWINEHDRLLPIVLLLSLVLEVLVFRALVASPPAAREWWSDLRSQVPKVVRRYAPSAIVLLGTLFYIGFFCFFLLRWHYKLRTGNFDLSINNNLMYGGLHGRFLESPVVFPQDPGKYLANHAKFGGYLFLPIYALYPRPETLLVLQSLLIGLSALPLWSFARRHVSTAIATLVTIAYLLYYPMHGASFSEFQYVPIAGFFILTTVWAAETRRWVIFWIVFGAGILMREDMPIGMAVVGLFLLVTGHRPVPGLVMAAISVSYFFVLRFHIMEEAGQWWFPNMYKELWADGEKGFRSVIKTLISNPLYVVSKIVVEKKILYLMHLLVPLAFLPVRRWYLWAAFIPGSLLTLLITNYDPPITFSFHYVMHWTPYLFLATVLALKAIKDEALFGRERQWAATIALLTASSVLSYNYGAFPMRAGSFRGGFHKIDFELREDEKRRYQDLQALIAMIPKDAAVAATEKLGPHVSSRVKMYTMRHGPQKAEYILASSRELKLSRTKPRLYEAVKTGEFGVVRRIRDLALLKRGHDTSGNSEMIRDWRLQDSKSSGHRSRRGSDSDKSEESKSDPKDHPDADPAEEPEPERD